MLGDGAPDGGFGLLLGNAKPQSKVYNVFMGDGGHQ